MKTQELTLQLYSSLRDKGYTYFYGSIEEVPEDEFGNSTLITLTPIKFDPENLPIPEEFHAWYSFSESGTEMAKGVDTIKFVVLLPETIIA
ncbi:hypothetical protein N180_20615 [Pedobacter antarcticus 4BY]|jgi:hypothetical protein|uniref:Uncharacterized protein n=2 Tax=Pedobacter antarcticus TaxID=34086 RepID=A0A081PGL7_9SPHI|nr:hypothetical protein [Pedobacter antarcticus]KEQ29840.1 hypothetical protein N180_20615 [Pedobacter antarcticus 4BY]SFF44322.1 hypothetical protein SAMN03003324_03908 [Pedobacter antarcticus]